MQRAPYAAGRGCRLPTPPWHETQPSDLKSWYPGAFWPEIASGRPSASDRTGCRGSGASAHPWRSRSGSRRDRARARRLGGTGGRSRDRRGGGRQPHQGSSQSSRARSVCSACTSSVRRSPSQLWRSSARLLKTVGELQLNWLPQRGVRIVRGAGRAVGGCQDAATQARALSCRRGSSNSCSPSATLRGSRTGAGGMGVIGSLAAGCSAAGDDGAAGEAANRHNTASSQFRRELGSMDEASSNDPVRRRSSGQRPCGRGRPAVQRMIPNYFTDNIRTSWRQAVKR